MSAGTLYLVGTPIGNLEDVTLRALKVLKEVSLVAAEDTRRTKQLFMRHGVTTALTSLHEHNERAKGAQLLERLKAGESIALVTDAGMPTVSDPGADLVTQTHAAGVRVEVIPGPSAVTTALALSGFRGERFQFEGFPPKKSAAMERWLRGLAEEEDPVVCFESPYRVVKTLQTIQKVLGEIPVAVARELTKMHEELTRGSTSEVLARYTTRAPKGECTIIFIPVPYQRNQRGQTPKTQKGVRPL